MSIEGPNLVQVRCASCKRLLGVATNQYRVSCDELCASDFDMLPFEARDAVIAALSYTYGGSMMLTDLMSMFKLSRQRVDQVLTRRDIKKAQQEKARQREKKLAELETLS